LVGYEINDGSFLIWDKELFQIFRTFSFGDMRTSRGLFFSVVFADFSPRSLGDAPQVM
jgi:hypothetical protein